MGADSSAGWPLMAAAAEPVVAAARILWTKHLVKKQKTWHDGFCIVRGRTGVLYDEDGRVWLYVVRRPLYSY
jgi:Protein of unknown function (DUF2439)